MELNHINKFGKHAERSVSRRPILPLRSWVIGDREDVAMFPGNCESIDVPAVDNYSNRTRNIII